MANWNNPTLASTYTDVLGLLKERDVDAITLQVSAPTNLPTGAIRYNRTDDKFQEWNGATWDDVVIAIAGGGTGQATAAAARSALGLGDIATQNANTLTFSSNAAIGTSGAANFSGGGSFSGAFTFNTPPTAAQFILSGAVPVIDFRETGVEVDAKNWRIQTDGGSLHFTIYDDAYTAYNNVLVLQRSGYAALTTLDLKLTRGNIHLDNDSNTGVRLFFEYNAGYSGYITWGEISVAYRWSIGCEPADATLYFRSGLTDGTIRAALSADQFQVPRGTEAAPGVAFLSDPDTGFSYVGAFPSDLIGLSYHGAYRFSVSNTQISFAVPGSGGSYLALSLLNTGLVLGVPTDPGHTGAIVLALQGNSVSTGAPSAIRLSDRDGIDYFIWVDTTGDLRISTSEPTVAAGDLIGTVVGSQS